VIYAANSGPAVWATGSNIQASFGATRATRNTNYPVGQCTYWADTRFNAWTGRWIAWTGNANQWPANAHALGWTVGGSPRAGSIVEYEPWHYGAGSVGHVAWVLDYYPNLGKVLVSEMNYSGNGGGLNRVDYRLVTAIDSANIHYIYVNPAP
jgi:surface antigen